MSIAAVATGPRADQGGLPAATLGVVLGGHFLSAFAVLGMPLFLPVLLGRIDPHAPAWLGGALYALPPLMTGLSAPFWGRLADRYGRLLSLRRAYLGLAAGFLLAGCSHDVVTLAAALTLQGLCGGAMAASNAYLAGQTDRDGLRRALNWTQFSARLAMVAAPVAIGLAIAHAGPAGHAGSPVAIYRWLALLPLAALLGSLALPVDRPAPRSHERPARSGALGSDLIRVLLLQGALCAAMVVTFPYFVPYAGRLGLRDTALAGACAALPHLSYLVGLPMLRGRMPRAAMPRGFGLIALACLGQAAMAPSIAPSLTWAMAWALPPLRVLMGVGLLLAYLGLHHALSLAARDATAGRAFGRFDAVGKWAGAGGGLAAGWCVQHADASAPFGLAAGLAALGCAGSLGFSKLSRPARQDCGDR